MNRHNLKKILLTILGGGTLCCAQFAVQPALAGGLGGRGGGGGGGGMQRGASMNRGNFGGGMPSAAARPNVSAMPNRPSVPQMPVTRPQSSVPHLGGNSMPNQNWQRPASPLPSTRPQNNLGGNVAGGKLPNTNLPTNKLPNTNLPNTKLPGGNLPADKLPGGNLPTNKLPGGSLPTNKLPGGNLPANKLPGDGVVGGMPDFSKLPQGRPSPGDLGNYLGLNQTPRPTTRPADQVRPATDISKINLGNNTNINTRPAWVNINQNQITQINHQWQGQMNNLANWPTTYPARVDHYHRWGNDLRHHWNVTPGYFGPSWWNNHPFHCSGWHYFNVYWNYPYTYWWTTPTYNQAAQWLAWSAVANQSPQPAYYDYGTGGNVTYEDNRVYIAGQPVATSDEYAASAAALATVEAPKAEDEVKQTQWLPLGTFALTTSQDDLEPNQIVQLAVDKTGIIAGTLHDKSADTTVALQGRVDKETQRVAVRVGDSDRVVAETGLYNLTQDEAPVLVHFGDITQDNYLLVRLPEPTDKAGGAKSQ